MASYHAPGSISRTLRTLLRYAVKESDFADADVEILRVPQFREAAAPLDKGLSLTLYRVSLSQLQRNLTRQFDPTGPHRPPLPLDLHYLITAWWKDDPIKQHSLLAWGMRTLEDLTTLTAGTLNDLGLTTDTFFENESLEIVYNPLSFGDMNSVMDQIKPHGDVSAYYTVRVVMIDSLAEVIEAREVQTRVFKMAEGPR